MSVDFLVEIGTEELPPKALRSLSEALGHEIVQSLAEINITHGQVKLFATPRRLAVFIEQMAEQADDSDIEAWGPPLKICFDNQGNPTKPALAFVDKYAHLGASIDSLKQTARSDGKTEKLYLQASVPGETTKNCIPGIINKALAALPIPKRMRWGAGKAEFVRPVHWVVLLLGDEVLDSHTILDITPSNQSRGHRFHAPAPVTITTPGSYQESLRQAFVIADLDERKTLINNIVVSAGSAANGTAVIDNDLLEEVTALNEWPVVMTGHFDEDFLSVPAEAVISSMKSHQKYFHVVDTQNNLLPVFITIANIDSTQPEKVIAGNEKVIRPRLADAAFFYETDLKSSQEARRERLKSIVFQDKLGSIYDKTVRISALSEYLAPLVGADPETARRSGELAKSDLVSEMVLEFDDLQGLMGRYYAIHDNEPAGVAAALFEHYLPRFSGDLLPESSEGIALAIADRIDTLVGIFGIGQLPTGSKDPFALRRASLGVLRILIEKNLDLSLSSLLEKSIAIFKGIDLHPETCKQVLTYILDRFNAMYSHINPEIIQSVMEKQLDNPLDIHLRIQAVNAFYQLPESASLAAANKRVKNILAKATTRSSTTVDQDKLVEEQEKHLVAMLDSREQMVMPLIRERRYTEALTSLADLQNPVDAFFDGVMVMTDDSTLRENRFAILTRLQLLFLNIADISHLAVIKHD